MNIKVMAVQTMLALGILGMSLTAFSAQAFAEDVSVQVRSIAASKNGESFDSRLADLRPQLSKGFGSYTNFTLVDQTQLSLGEGKSQTVQLPNGTAMTLTFHGFAGNLAKIGMGIADKMNTTLRLSRGSTFFQAGLSYKDGILIVAIKVL